MEFEVPPFRLNYLNLFFLFTFLFFVWKQLSKTREVTRKFPPGPLKLPLIGNMHNLISGHPHQVLSDMAKKYGPIMHLQLGEVSTVVVSSAEMAKQVLVTHDPGFANRPERLASKVLWYDQQDMIFSPYGDHWRQVRKICIMELLSSKNVRSFDFIVKDEILKMMESIRSSKGLEVNITDKFFWYTSSISCRAAFGRTSNDQEKMIEYLKKAFALAAGFAAADVFPSIKLLAIISGLKGKLLKMHHEMDAILDDVIAQHKENHKNGKKCNAQSGGEDLVDVLLRQQQNPNLQIPITTRIIKALLFDIFTGASDTSSVTLEWAMSELMKNPSMMTKAQSEVRQVCEGKKAIVEADIQKLIYLKMVVKETLRLHPPAPLIPRASRENREVQGYMIPDKTQVLVNAWAIGRDVEHWDDPESFKPERFEQKSIDYMGNHFQYIPFGAGRRMCPGITFSLTSIQLLLAHLLYHFDWKLPNGMKSSDLDMDEGVGLSVGRKNSLYLVATAYSPYL